MHPIICQLGPFTIYSYGLALAFGFILAVSLARAEARREKFNPDTLYNFVFISFISGIIGARAFYVIENLNFYLESPIEIIMLQHGGLSWFGGLILGTVSGILYLKKKKIPVLKSLDLIAPFLALAQAIGRIGCYLNGCCFGKTAIPVQVISSGILLFIFLILRFFQGRWHKAGQIFYLYLILYSVKRFSVEFVRLDNPAVFGGLTLFQILSLAIFVGSCLGYFFATKNYSK